MAPGTSSDPALAFALAVTLAAIASAALLLAAIVAMRVLRKLEERRLASRSVAWRRAFHEATEDVAAAKLPRIAPADLPAFLAMWNHFEESVRGRASENLAALLRRDGIEARARELLGRRSTRLRLIAATALGHLREESAWAELEALAASADPVLSFAAARALLRIEPRRALDRLGADLAARDDWPLSRVGSLLQELGPALATPPLARLLAAPPGPGEIRLLRLLRFGHREVLEPAVRDRLSRREDPEVLAAALDYVEDGEDLAFARGAARHAAPAVRMAAARAIGRIGDAAELAVLLELLRDRDYGVRYHAARSLVALPGLAAGDLDQIQAKARDAFAADMLGHARAEREAA